MEENKKSNSKDIEEKGKVEKTVAKQPDVLDEIRALEIAARRAVLVKTMMDLKRLCKEVLESKEKCNCLLKEAGIGNEDIKRVIDFVNSMSTIKLNESDCKRISDWAKDKVSTNRSEVEKAIEKKADIFDLFKPQTFFASSGNIGGIINAVPTPNGPYDLNNQSTGGNPNLFKTHTTAGGLKGICGEVDVLCMVSQDGAECKVKI